MTTMTKSKPVAEAARAGHWRCVWHVPAAITGWRSQLDHLRGDEYLGTGKHESEDLATTRGRADQEKFEDIGFPEGVRFLRAEFFPNGA